MDAKALTSILNSLSASFHNPTLHLYPSTHKNFEWILFNPKDMKLAREAYDNNEINLRTDPNIPQVDSLFHEDALICQPISKISSDLMKMFNAGVLKKLSNECIDKCFDILSRFVLIDARKLNHEMAFLFFSISPSLLAINSLNNWEKYNISDYLMMCMKVSKFLKFHQNEDECSRCKRFDNNKCFAAILYEQKQLLMFIRKRIELFCCEFLSKVISFCFESIFDSKFHLYFDNLFLLVEIYSKFSQFREAILNQYLASMYMIMETEKHITINKKKVSIFTYGILTIFQSSLLFRIQTDNDLNILISEFYNLVGVIKNFFQCVIEIYSQKNQNFLLTIIKDLCNIWFNPEWSIVDILLKNIMDILVKINS